MNPLGLIRQPQEQYEIDDLDYNVNWPGVVKPYEIAMAEHRPESIQIEFSEVSP